MTDVILVVNSGSSSLRFAVYPAAEAHSTPMVRGNITGIGERPILVALDDRGGIEAAGTLNCIPRDATHEWLVVQLLEFLQHRYTDIFPVAAGHRVVHGGQEFPRPAIIDDTARKKLERLMPLAPLHLPHNFAVIDAIASVLPDLPQVGCFDTSFHQTQPRLAKLFGLPRELTDDGFIRYGFHGLSYEYIAHILPEYLGPGADGRVIVAHLGNGASMCAMLERKCVATSMGFTALDGLVMGRRCGSLDPGIVLHLIQQKGLSADEVWHMLYRESGLLGVSGISNDMRVLEKSSDPHAREAIELFCHRAECEIGSLAATIGGLDALVFTAGIGENSALVRDLICAQSAWVGIDLDEAANTANMQLISSDDSAVDVCVIPTNEEAVIAEATLSLFKDG